MQMQCKSKLPLKEISDKNLRKIIEKATEKKQADRYRSVSAMRVALEEAETNSRKNGAVTSQRVFTSSGEPSVTSKSDIRTAVTTAVTEAPNRKGKAIIGIVAAIAVVAIAAGIFIAIDNSNKEKERREQLMAQARADSIARVEAEKARAAEERKSWSQRLAEPDAGQDLKDLIAAAGGSGAKSAEAAYLYGGILARQSRVLPENIIARFSDNNPEDLSEAHIQYENALRADSTFYKASYELGYDYAMGSGTEIDLEKAARIMKDGLIQAKAKGDKEYEQLFETAIEKIGL